MSGLSSHICSKEPAADSCHLSGGFENQDKELEKCTEVLSGSLGVGEGVNVASGMDVGIGVGESAGMEVGFEVAACPD